MRRGEPETGANAIRDTEMWRCGARRACDAFRSSACEECALDRADDGTRATGHPLEPRLDRSRTLVLVTHDPALAAFADEVIALRDGRVVEHKPTSGVGFRQVEASSRQIGGKPTPEVGL